MTIDNVASEAPAGQAHDAGTVTNAAEAPPAPEPKPAFDPKAVFLEEWTRIVEPQWLKAGEDIESVWAEMANDDRNGRAVCAVPEASYRLFVRGAAHGWVYSAMKSAATRHHKQMEAYKTIYAAELMRLAAASGDACVTLDAGCGVLRLCDHDHSKEGAERAILGIPVSELLAKLKSALGVEG